MEFTVNGTKYFLNEFYDGSWFWGADKDESKEMFATAYEAQQSAIDYEKEKLNTSDDSIYNEATSQFFDRRDYQ